MSLRHEDEGFFQLARTAQQGSEFRGQPVRC
jgi:hypothetical protein